MGPILDISLKGVFLVASVSISRCGMRGGGIVNIASGGSSACRSTCLFCLCDAQRTLKPPECKRS